MVQGVVISEKGEIVDVNPRTGEVIALVPVSSVSEVADAVERSRAAQAAWAATPLEARIARLKRAIRDGVGGGESRIAELSELMTREMGKVSSEAVEEAEGVVNKDEMLDLIAKANADVRVAPNALVTREPYGVVGVIGPFNFPCDEILLLALPALAAGNGCVVKPSEVAPLCGAAVVGALAEGLPEGLVGLVQGDGAVGAALVERVDMVGMTGSSATGKKILASAAAELKPCVLELGGKDPMVVLESADLDRAAKDAVSYSVMNAGQVCCAVERVYVPEALKDEFADKVVRIARSYTPDAGTLAPLVSDVQKGVVSEHVRKAIDAGAKCLLGGPDAARELDQQTPPGSSYYPTTVLADVPHDANRDETFGPVVAITSYDTVDDAVRMANDTKYGLSASVYGADADQAARVASMLKAGQVGVNAWPLAIAPLECPWVGHSNSGFGYHSGFDGWRQFSVPKSIITAQDD